MFATVSWVDLPPVVVVIIAVGFTIFCIVDLVRAPAVRYLPKWAWVLICVVSEPLGGIVYLIVGRDRGGRS